MTFEEYKVYLNTLATKRVKFIKNIAKRDQQKKPIRKLITKRFTKTKKP